MLLGMMLMLVSMPLDVAMWGTLPLLVAWQIGASLSQAVYIGMNLFVMMVALAGIALFVYGYLHREMTSQDLGIMAPLSILLILWGAGATLFVIVAYQVEADRTTLPGMSPFDILDYVTFWSMGIKGILLAASGFLLVIIGVGKTLAKRKKTVEPNIHAG